MADPALYVVYLGGRAPGCHLEVHDVVFAAGRSLNDIHSQLLDQWFGDREQVHVDAWARVETVPGYRVKLSARVPTGSTRLYFVNLGGYVPGELMERHASALYGGDSVDEVKKRAREELLNDKHTVHRDDLYEVDDMLAIRSVQEFHVHLEPDRNAGSPEVTNGYFPVPRETVDEWMREYALD